MTIIFYDRFLQLCDLKGVSPSKAAITSGINKSTVSYWKNNPSSLPTGQIAIKLADYFGISVGELYGNEKTEDKLQEEVDQEYEITDKFIASIVAQLTAKQLSDLAEELIEKRSKIGNEDKILLLRTSLEVHRVAKRAVT